MEHCPFPKILNKSFSLSDSTNKSQTHVLLHSNVNANSELETMAMETTRTLISSIIVCQAVALLLG